MKRVLPLFLFILLLITSVQAQSLYSTKWDSLMVVDPGYVPDQALVDSLNPRKPLWMPAVEAIGFNLALGAFNTYVTKSEFAKISFKRVR